MWVVESFKKIKISPSHLSQETPLCDRETLDELVSILGGQIRA